MQISTANDFTCDDGELATLRKLYGGKSVDVLLYSKPTDDSPRLWAVPQALARPAVYRDDASYKLAGAVNLVTGRLVPARQPESQDKASAPHGHGITDTERRVAAAIVWVCKTALKLLFFSIVGIIAVAEIATMSSGGGRR